MLSKRLQTITDLIEESQSLADIGSDHGLIPVNLLNENRIPYAVITDIREGPLFRAGRLIKQKNLTSRTSLRLGSGLKPLKNSEVSQVVIAGMGGETIDAILKHDPQKSHSFKRFILQPMTGSDVLRKYLVENSFKIEKELIVKETTGRKEHYFKILLVTNGETEYSNNFELEFGLLDKTEKNTDYRDYINYEINLYQSRLDKMKQSDNPKTIQRRLDFERRLSYLREIYEDLKNNPLN